MRVININRKNISLLLMFFVVIGVMFGSVLNFLKTKIYKNDIVFFEARTDSTIAAGQDTDKGICTVKEAQKDTTEDNDVLFVGCNGFF